jgi:hypothetical protein
MKPTTVFQPVFDILPQGQRALWPLLDGVSDLGFVLYGGTALALRLGHRQSVDFDFFNCLPLDKDKLYACYPFLKQGEHNQVEENTLSITINPNDGTNAVKVSFFGNIDFGRVGTPDLAEGFRSMLVASLDDIMATKLKTVMQRVAWKDYVDIATLIEHGVSLTKGIASLDSLFGEVVPPAFVLQTLTWFNEPQLSKLSEHCRNVLIHAVELTYPEVEYIKPSPVISTTLVDETFATKLQTSSQV